jgi:hypothetical protein
VDSEAQMRRSVQAAARMRIGYVFITDDRGPNPYDRLPSYWEAEARLGSWACARGPFEHAATAVAVAIIASSKNCRRGIRVMMVSVSSWPLGGHP